LWDAARTDSAGSSKAVSALRSATALQGFRDRRRMVVRVPLTIMKMLTENHFSFKCPMNWDEMEVSANGRFCGKCRKEVFDLSNCSIDEVIALQRRHGSICGSIKVAVAAVSLSAAACNDSVPGGGVKRDADSDFTKPRYNVTAGIICSPEQLEEMKKE